MLISEYNREIITFDTISHRSNTRCLIPLFIIRYCRDNTILYDGLFPFIGLLVGQSEVKHRCKIISIESQSDLKLMLGFSYSTESTITFPERVVKSLITIEETERKIRTVIKTRVG